MTLKVVLLEIDGTLVELRSPVRRMILKRSRRFSRFTIWSKRTPTADDGEKPKPELDIFQAALDFLEIRPQRGFSSRGYTLGCTGHG
jgi:FMN phosphatase YigB (HAD superfamily)